MRYISVLLSVFLLFSCRHNYNPTAMKDYQAQEGNVFLDEILQQIYNYQNDRNSDALAIFLEDEFPEYRQAAAMAFASVQDESRISELAILLNDPIIEVRNAAAFALGQTFSSKAETFLLDVLLTENSNAVRATIFESLGKCATQKGLHFVSKMNLAATDLQLLEGQATALSHLSIRGITSDKSTSKAIELINPYVPEKVRYLASFYFKYAKDISLSSYKNALIAAFDKDGFVYTKINLVSAFGKINHPDILDELILVLNSNTDYRIKVNAIKALSNFANPIVHDHVFAQLDSKNSQVAVQAAQFFVDKGQKKYASKYENKAWNLTNWRAKTLMLKAAMKHGDNKKSLSNTLMVAYEVSANPYEKAAFLSALSHYVPNYKYLEEQMNDSKIETVTTAAIEALVNIRHDSEFNNYAKQSILTGKKNLEHEFTEIFTKAVKSKDVAMICAAAEILREPELNFNEMIDNTYFLNQAISKLKLPEDLEAFFELKKTIKFYTGEDIANPNYKYVQPDWNTITSTSPTQKVNIITSKGKIIVELDINNAPVTVSNFLNLIKSGFYKDNFVHRVAPNFVMQSGCPRGDGWGGSSEIIRSEFSPLKFNEAVIGMASAGKDTEGSQWFIMHSPAPHLNGKYTAFGKVIAGMDVVHKIELGDEILSIEIE